MKREPDVADGDRLELEAEGLGVNKEPGAGDGGDAGGRVEPGVAEGEVGGQGVVGWGVVGWGAVERGVFGGKAGGMVRGPVVGGGMGRWRRVAAMRPEDSARPAASTTSAAARPAVQGRRSPQIGQMVMPSCGPWPPAWDWSISQAVRARTLSGLTYFVMLPVMVSHPRMLRRGRRSGSSSP
ncbi:hypothetical protein GCM10010435_92940 [Winogradskya consettensis]